MDKVYKDANFVIISTLTNYNTGLNCFNMRTVESVIVNVFSVNPELLW